MLLELLAPKQPVMVGIDISSSTIKLLELSKTATGYRVESYATEPLPLHAVMETEIKEPEIVGKALSNLMKRVKLKTKYAAIAVAGSAVITKTIEMSSSLKDKELFDQIMSEADRHIPYPLEEVNLDYVVIGPSKKNPTNVEILLAASRAENVLSRVEILSYGGLVPKVVDIEAFAFERAFTLISSQLPNKGRNQTVAIVDIGSSITTLNVLHDGNTIYTREQLFGGRQLTEEVQRRYGLTFEEAVFAKKRGGLPDDYQTEVLDPFIDALVQQVNRSLQFFFSSTHYTEINHIVLAGGSAMTPGLTERIESQIGSKASVANPFANMSIAPKVNAHALFEDAPSLMICCGLAMRSFIE